jgi:hypothetical protein
MYYCKPSNKRTKNSQCMHERNIEACSRNRPCLGKTISITYPKCVFIALVIQHPKRVRHIVFPCDLSGSTIFVLRYLRKGTIWTWRLFWFFQELKLSHSKKKLARCYHKCTYVFMQSIRYFCQVLMKLEFSRRIFEKSWNIKFHENPSSRSRVVSWGGTEGHDEANSRFSLFSERASFSNSYTRTASTDYRFRNKISRRW